MKYVIEYTSEDYGTFDSLSEEQKRERTRTVKFTSRYKADGFCEGVEAACGTVLKKRIE